MGSSSEVNNGSNNSGTGVYSSDGQGFCLRWNNHKANLVEIIESLVQMECYVDCTIYVDNHVQFKAHRVVLAACSPFFQLMLKDATQDKCSLIFPGVQEFEMRTLLEYIYAGEVNIAETQIPKIMRIAKMLEVKGLQDITDITNKISQQKAATSPGSNPFRPSSNSPSVSLDIKREQSTYLHPLSHSSPIIKSSAKISSAQSSSSSPPYKPPFIAQLYGRQGNTSREILPVQQEHLDERLRTWPPMPLSLSRSAHLSSVYETGSDMNPLKRKKLSSINSMLMTNDTPILRNVLAQSNIADSSQNSSLLSTNPSPPRASGNGNDNIENNDTNNNENLNNSSHSGNNVSAGNNGSVYVGYVRKNSDRSYHSSNGSENSEKKYKEDEPASPCTERSFDDDPTDRRTSPPEFLADLRLPAYLQQHQLQQAAQQHGQAVQGGSGQNQKPEWKRYKQYTRNDIMSAIECVRNGMSALQASRRFGVPSRTLYDKVKKMGITTGTPRNRSSIKRDGREGAGTCSSSAAFPYGLAGAPGGFGVYPNQDSQLSQSQDFDPELDHQRVNPHAASLLDPVFLQKALEARGEEFRGDALHAMALAAAAHAQFNGINQTSPRRQSPNLLAKYMERNIEAEMIRERERSRLNGEHTTVKREVIEESDEEMDVSDRAENLSLSKQDSSPPRLESPIHAQSFVQALLEQPRGVIVPPMKYASPRAEPTSTTPPASEIMSNCDKLEFKQNLSEDSPIAFTPTTTANYDE